MRKAEKEKAKRERRESVPWKIDTGLKHRGGCGGKIIDYQVPDYGPGKMSGGQPVIGLTTDDVVHFHARRYRGHKTKYFFCQKCDAQIPYERIEELRKKTPKDPARVNKA